MYTEIDNPLISYTTYRLDNIPSVFKKLWQQMMIIKGIML